MQFYFDALAAACLAIRAGFSTVSRTAFFVAGAAGAGASSSMPNKALKGITPYRLALNNLKGA